LRAVTDTRTVSPSDINLIEELIRVVNEAQSVTPETNVVFMSSSSGNGLHLFTEDGAK
jgi:hypothetical protein